MRNYPGAIDEYRHAVQSNRVPLKLTIPMSQNYFAVFDSQLSRIGNLPADVVGEVTIFYTQLKALIEDVRPDATQPRDADEAVQLLTSLADLLRDTLERGRRLVPKLQKVAKQPANSTPNSGRVG